MPLDNYGAIANSMATLPNPVNAFIDARQGARSQRRRDALTDATVSRQNALAAQDQQSAQQGQHNQELTQALAKVRWMKSQGNLAGQLRADPQKAAQLSQQMGEDLLALPEDQVAERFNRLEGHLASMLGEMPPAQKPAPGPVQVSDDGIITQDGAYKGQRPLPRAAAAPRAAGGGAAQRAPSGYRWAADGQSLEVIPGGPAVKPDEGDSQIGTDGNGWVIDYSKTTDGERTAVGYLDRIVSARQAIEAPGMANYVPSMSAFMGFASLLDDDTGVVGAATANKFLNDTDREYMGQALDLILAKMRKESGATIKGGEFRKEYINLFPMPGDPPKVLADKKIKRQLAENQLRKAAGRAAGPVATAPEAPQGAGKNPEVQAALKPKDGQRGKSRSGKPIIFRNGQWEYE